MLSCWVNNRPAGDRSSETSSHPIDTIMVMMMIIIIINNDVSY
jgi:hypothetical protein